MFLVDVHELIVLSGACQQCYPITVMCPSEVYHIVKISSHRWLFSLFSKFQSF